MANGTNDEVGGAEVETDSEGRRCGDGGGGGCSTKLQGRRRLQQAEETECVICLDDLSFVLASNNASPAQSERGPRRDAQPLHATPLSAVLFPAPLRARALYFFRIFLS